MYKFGKNVALGIVLIGTMCLTGCFSMESAYVNATREEHILVRNYGWQLFNCIPVFCGNASNNAFCPWAFFRDDVTMDKIQSRVLDYAKEHGKTAHDLTYHNYETVIFSIPLTGIAVPIPYIICYREIQLSGVMK